jgi:hypothetical protein
VGYHLCQYILAEELQVMLPALGVMFDAVVLFPFPAVFFEDKIY